MSVLQRGKGRRDNTFAAVAAASAVLALGALAGGCATSVQTPLPDIRPASSTSLSQEEREKAVEELNRKRATHEQDAEAQIEQAR